MLNHKKPFLIAFGISSLVFIGTLNLGNQKSELLAHSVAPEEYTLQHATIDMEGIHNRLVQSTETLQDIAQSFTTLVERLEEKKQQQVTANN